MKSELYCHAKTNHYNIIIFHGQIWFMHSEYFTKIFIRRIIEFYSIWKSTFYGVSYFWVVRGNNWEITLKFISTHSFYYRVISNWWQQKSQEQTQWSHSTDIWEWVNGQRVTKFGINSYPFESMHDQFSYYEIMTNSN